MLYYLFIYLHEAFNFPGAGVFQYISFRAAMAVIVSLLISLMFGKQIISFLAKKQVGESIRDLGLEGQVEKKGTPTMGGVLILLGLFSGILLWGDLSSIHIWFLLYIA